MRGSRCRSDPVGRDAAYERTIKSRRSAFALWLITLMLLLPPAQSGAEEAPEIAYSVFIRDSCIYVWTDLSAVVDSRTLEQLREGVDLAFECRAELNEPRRFWADRKVASSLRSLRIRYYSLSEEYEIADRQRPDSVLRRTGSMARLYGYLADSVEICLGNHTSLDSDHGYVLDLSISVISLTDMNLVERIESDSASAPPLHYLFGQFLKLTGFGRTTYPLKSRVFTIDELETISVEED